MGPPCWVRIAVPAPAASGRAPALTALPRQAFGPINARHRIGNQTGGRHVPLVSIACGDFADFSFHGRDDHGRARPGRAAPAVSGSGWLFFSPVKDPSMRHTLAPGTRRTALLIGCLAALLLAVGL